jgi:hypothetical protein
VYGGLWQTAVFRPRIAKKKIFVPQIATAKILNLRVDCQGVISVVANRGTLESGLPRGYSCLGKPRYLTRNLANDRIPAPAILHRQFPSLSRHKFLLRDFPGVRPYAANCLGLNYTTTANIPSRDTIPLNNYREVAHLSVYPLKSDRIVPRFLS